MYISDECLSQIKGTFHYTWTARNNLSSFLSNKETRDFFSSDIKFGLYHMKPKNVLDLL